MVEGRWLRTEDFGWLDDDGLLHVASRRRDLIIRGGENVYPLEIEDRLDHHPAVAEAAVIGVPDDELGQRVHAIVVLHPGTTATPDELQRHCADGLAYFKVPATIELRPTPLPRSATGKVLKHLLESGDETTAPTDPD
jgi:acyl-CoA synthetase (AMP-forming)/AMP-acid ligase II